VDTAGHSISYADMICRSKEVLIYPFIHAQVELRSSATLHTKDNYKM